MCQCLCVFGSVGLSFGEIPAKLPHLSAALTTADLWLLGTIQASVLVFVCTSVFRTICGPVYSVQVFTPNATPLLRFGFTFMRQHCAGTSESENICKQVPDLLICCSITVISEFFFARTRCSVAKYLMCRWTSCSYGMSLLHRLPAWHAYYSIPSCLCQLGDSKERSFHF